MKFTKMHGIGNDYVYVDCFCESVTNPCALSKRLADRHFGVGGDGLILIMPSDCADVRMRMFNADGSEAMMCGNGIRCVAKYAYDHGIARKSDMLIETASGVKRLAIHTENGVAARATVNMGEPELAAQLIPMTVNRETFINQQVRVNGVDLYATAVNMGNPHWVFFMEEIEHLDLRAIGPGFEYHNLFPDRVNTEFAQVINRGEIKMRVWERGSGETLACGTGACAVAVAASLNGLCDKNTRVRLTGGDLDISWADDGCVYMTGPAAEVFSGEIDIKTEDCYDDEA